MTDADLSYQVFAGLLAAVLEDERISPDERERLDAYREKHRITDAQQSEALAAICDAEASAICEAEATASADCGARRAEASEDCASEESAAIASAICPDADD